MPGGGGACCSRPDDAAVDVRATTSSTAARPAARDRAVDRRRAGARSRWRPARSGRLGGPRKRLRSVSRRGAPATLSGGGDRVGAAVGDDRADPRVGEQQPDRPRLVGPSRPRRAGPALCGPGQQAGARGGEVRRDERDARTPDPALQTRGPAGARSAAGRWSPREPRKRTWGSTASRNEGHDVLVGRQVAGDGRSSPWGRSRPP